MHSPGVSSTLHVFLGVESLGYVEVQHLRECQVQVCCDFMRCHLPGYLLDHRGNDLAWTSSQKTSRSRWKYIPLSHHRPYIDLPGFVNLLWMYSTAISVGCQTGDGGYLDLTWTSDGSSGQ